MNFFKTLESQFPDADLTLRIKAKGGVFSISVLPVSTEENEIQPLIVSGGAAELDDQFFELIKKPLEDTITAIVNLEDQEKSVKDSSSKPATTSTTKPAPTKNGSKNDTKKAAPKKETAVLETGSMFDEVEEPSGDIPDLPVEETKSSNENQSSEE